MEGPEHPRQLPDHGDTVRMRMLLRNWKILTVFRSRTSWGVWMYIAGRGRWNSKNWQKAAGRRWIERAGHPAVLRRRWLGRPEVEAEGRRNVVTETARRRRKLGLGGRFGSK